MGLAELIFIKYHSHCTVFTVPHFIFIYIYIIYHISQEMFLVVKWSPCCKCVFIPELIYFRFIFLCIWVLCCPLYFPAPYRYFCTVTVFRLIVNSIVLNPLYFFCGLYFPVLWSLLLIFFVLSLTFLILHCHDFFFSV